MSFMKKFVDKLGDTFSSAKNALQVVIKENQQYISAELEVAKESKEGIASLKVYADTETEALGLAMNSLADTFEQIEVAREDKVSQLQEKFIAPLEELLRGFEVQQTELREAEKAKGDLEKAEKKLSKLKGKPKEKLKAGQMDSAEADVKAGEKKYEKEAGEAKIAAEEFNKKKLEALKLVLQDLVDIEISYHKKILDQIGTVKEKADAIDVAKEAVIEVEEEAEE